MTDTAHFIRPCKPECVAWTDCPDDVRDWLVEELGLTKVDQWAYRTHKRAYSRDENESVRVS